MFIRMNTGIGDVLIQWDFFIWCVFAVFVGAGN
jgi:hypothetical protein